jgi:O-methyltransferase
VFDYTEIPTENLRALSRYPYLNHIQRGFQTYLITCTILRENVPGACVECGVGSGGMPAAMALAMKQLKIRRPIHLFDSFEGIPLAGPKDKEQPGIGKITTDVLQPIEKRLVSSKIATCPVTDVKNCLAKWGFQDYEFYFHVGWFQKTMPGTNIGPIAFLRLDADLYESTECALQHLYPFVCPQGFVFIDDWGLAGCQQAVKDYFTSQPPAPYYQFEEFGAAYWRK